MDYSVLASTDLKHGVGLLGKGHVVDADGKVERVGEVDGLHHGLRHAIPDVEQGDRVVETQIPATGRKRESGEGRDPV